MPRSRWSWILFAVLLATPFAARALDREFVLRWLPPTGTVTGYRVYLSTSGQSTQTLDLGAVAPDTDGIAREALQLDAAKAFTVAMTAYNQAGESTQSNQITVPASTCDPAACSDGDPCTADDCQNLTCTHVRLPDGAVCGSGSVCLSGACRVPQCTSDANCTDADLCDGRETCSGFNCVSGTPLSCPAPSACQQGGCSASSGCWTTNRPDGTTCNDSNASTVNDQCSAGRCVGIPFSGCQSDAACSDANLCNGRETCGSTGACVTGASLTCPAPGPCQQGGCSASSGCWTTNRPDGTACNDSNASTVNDQCSAGRCVGIPFSGCQSDAACSDGNLCNGQEACGPTGTCVTGTLLVCGNATQCADPICNTSTGCALTPKPDGTSCDDGQTSTTADRCTAGQCSGTPVVADRLSLSSVTPDNVRRYGYYRIPMSGSGFGAGMKVSFRSPSMYRAPWVQKVTVSSTGKAEMLIWASPRKYSTTWDVVVTLPDGRMAGLPAGFRTDP